MRVRNVSLERFKRFTKLNVGEIPESAKLCIIAGPNGSGKSSFFEAFNVWKRTRHHGLNWSLNYHVKSPQDGEIDHSRAVKIDFHGGDPKVTKKAIYIRSAYRNDPSFEIKSLSSAKPTLDENRLQMLIENDAVVSSNYQRLAAQALEDVFEREQASLTIGDFREKVIGDIKSATMRLFPDLVMNSIGNPLSSGTFRFDKGSSKGFLYQNLSGGEKAAFDLLLDIIVKRRELDDTVFCIDEPEAHMNTRLQGALLDELFNAMGDNCQLWLATHSIGMMRRARDIAKHHPGAVVFLDFGGRDFDVPQTVAPELPTRAFWQKVLDVAFDDFAALVAPTQVVICEGSRLGTAGPNAGMDARILDRIFGSEFPDTRFITGGNSHEVKTDRIALIQTLEALVQGTKVQRLVDRDDMSDEEVAERLSEGVRVLTWRNLESYMFHDSVISRLCDRHGAADKSADIIRFKKEELARAHVERGKPLDDLKSSSGAIVDYIKKALKLRNAGNTPKDFMHVTLADCMQDATEAYLQLRDDIFG